jgi:type 1 glutamine amidotransferase
MKPSPIRIAYLLLLSPFALMAQSPIPLLILSGQNNHEWQKTTPELFRIFQKTGRFAVSVTERPDTLKYADYKHFKLIVSNFNLWPDTSTRWAGDKEEAFARYIREGGGALFIHAGGSSFYGWSDYHRIAIGRWGPETSHGAIGPARITFDAKPHPITQGLNPFTITDEIWENTDYDPDARILAWAQELKSDGTPEPARYPALLTTTFGKGRSAYTILGHDEKALENPDLGQVLVRAALWAAKVLR